MSSEPVAMLVDGRAPVGGWPLDRGLHYGDGLFETMQVRAGRVRFMALHRRRLATGVARLHFTCDEQQAWAEVAQEATRHADATLKLIVTRGDAVARGYSPTGTEIPRRLLLTYDAASPVPDRPSAVRLAATLGENPLLAGLKHTNRLEQVLARAELAQYGAFEGLMASSSGRLVSGTMSNVFIRLEGQWHTPLLARCGVTGVMRTVVLREAAIAGHVIRESDLPWSVLEHCEELFISNARLGVLPLFSLDGRELPVSQEALDLRGQVAGIDE